MKKRWKSNFPLGRKLQKIFSGESSFSNLVEAWGGSKSDAYIYIDEISWKTEVGDGE